MVKCSTVKYFILIKVIAILERKPKTQVKAMPEKDTQEIGVNYTLSLNKCKN